MRLHRLAPLAAAATVALALLSPGTASSQTAEEKAAARSLAQQGAEALQKKDYAEAIDLLSRAEAIIHAPPHLLLIGRGQVGLGKLVAARESFLKIIREELPASAPAAFKRAQEDARTELAAIEPRIGSLRIVLTGPGATDPAKVTVKLDEQGVTSALIGVHRPIDPGKHVVTATAAGRSPVTQEVSLGDGEKKEVSLEVEAPAAGAALPDGSGQTGGGGGPVGPEKPQGTSPLKYVGIAGMGLGGAGIIAGTIFTVMFVSKSGDADAAFKACPKPCPDDQQANITALDEAAASRGTGAIVGFAAGAALAGAGVALFLIGGKQDKPAGASVMPYVAPNGAGLVGRF
ncbi:hypothetical protein [Polyangium mundeleinium]|uniref:Tetratricopeptide repeat protein n=1 Tax=Polyangium mundeleinium TaxID=2995306 RepID=A0ABT5EVB2_9BACT|nr:hypothetical protein [Polyangium mundeleinium]MDC0745128.1 hypothetical protein [Polyangium mundeleinium]